MAAEITRVSCRSSAWFYRARSHRNRGHGDGGGRDASVMMTTLWARILKILLPVDVDGSERRRGGQRTSAVVLKDGR
jgi:hypothetical protein